MGENPIAQKIDDLLNSLALRIRYQQQLCRRRRAPGDVDFVEGVKKEKAWRLHL